MKKNTIRWLAVLAIALTVYHIAIFAVPFPKNGAFFLSWVFTVAAILLQIYTVRAVFYRDESMKSKFYGFPIAKISASYLIIQTVLGLCFMAADFAAAVPLWVPLVLYALLLGAAAVGFISADAMRDEIERQDEKLEKDVRNMRLLQSKAASMPSLAQDDGIRKMLEEFSESLRFSDPVSSAETESLEADLTACADELRQAAAAGDRDAVSALLQKAGAILAERNSLCKLMK